MTLKEELEILRGAPIKLKTPVEQVPCNETSDPEKLCKHPVVSVHMFAYNHEKFIRQAIEGVVMQETDFEYELVIGEDASPDRTREICFEYQKKYPDKIRVLWSEENVTKPYGGNGARIAARCRGEFIAFCEGDDYWTDPTKLQKQVEIFRQYPTVNYCFARVRLKKELDKGGRLSWWKETKWDENNEAPWNPQAHQPGFIDGETFWKNRQISPMTNSVMVRSSFLKAAREQFDIFSWQLCLGDRQIWYAAALLGDVYFLDDETGVYRIHGGGICSRAQGDIERDVKIVDLYFLAQATPHAIKEIRSKIRSLLIARFSDYPDATILQQMHSLCALPLVRRVGAHKRLLYHIFRWIRLLRIPLPFKTYWAICHCIARILFPKHFLRHLRRRLRKHPSSK